MYAHPLVRRSEMSFEVPALLRPDGRLSAAPPAQRILVPTDGSGAEEVALRHVVELARTSPVVIHLLNVQPPVMAGDVTWVTTADMVTHQRQSAGVQLVQRASGVLTAARIAHTTEVAFGSPVTEIVRSAAAHACTKIVMATRNTGLMKLLLRRSVAHRVVALAAIPVTLVKPSAARGDQERRCALRVLQVPTVCAWRKRSGAPAETYRAA